MPNASSVRSPAPTALPHLPRSVPLRIGLGLLLVLLLAYPWIAPGGYLRYAGVLVVMYAVLSTSWSMVGGFTGYVSLGHAAFFGLGAYATGIGVVTLGLPHAAAFVLGVLVVAVFAAVAGLAAVRARGASFVIVTIAMVTMLSLLAQDMTWLTGGSAGLQVPGAVAGISRTGNHALFFYLFTVLLLFALLTWWFIDRSRYGAGLKAIREDEEKAEALGVPTTAYKVAALTVSAAFTGAAGGLYAMWFGNLDPIFVFSLVLGSSMVLMALLGGSRYLLGPTLGAFVVAPANEYFLTQHGESQLHIILSGALLFVVVLFMPEGVIPAVQRALRRFRPQSASIREQTQQELHESRGAAT
ncbi:amino acid/amide ABC transporter membrane protein 2 (HAAT family) [Murinocardiopsis flavida]|uniref:Amino acid/amide ABC transporter membrane protein 2 (HAAT family) n=1 Tax=Murinocardiopsis flavida TaxID=645275 RepID=A0A2P8DSU8_9ACTN|nr:branched-chain amino acid ABC transporter permease [Murinocardiopsis flavida]PSL00287.1 amino acid/amide ABC transporter membrane protein 2 (HAAT family) [Murinocardiopsis flavida]